MLRSVFFLTGPLLQPLLSFVPLVVSQFRVRASAQFPSPSLRLPGGTHRFDWNSTLATVDCPIFGADFLCLRENGLTINPQKSVFGQEEVKFLGH